MEKSDNELIAEFMGGAIDLQTGSWQNLTQKIKHYALYSNELKYSTSWDWLMPVVEKIEKHGATVELNICLATMCRIVALNGSRDRVIDFCNGGSISLLDATYLSVVEFIKWYNSQSKNP